MTRARLIAMGLTGLACVGIWFAWDNITEIRRTSFWEFRFLILLCGAFVALSLVETIVARIEAREKDD